jgi:hypothetical protein
MNDSSNYETPVTSYNHDTNEDIYKMQEYANNFLVYYYAIDSTMLEETKITINRIFNMYMKNIILSSKFNVYDMESLLLFINGLNNENDKYDLKSNDNISNLIKYLHQANMLLITNKIMCEELNNLMIYIMRNNIKLKKSAYVNLINIVNNNLHYIEKNYTALINKHGLSHSKYIGYSIHERVEILTLYIYNNILEIINEAVEKDYVWLDYVSIDNLNYFVRLKLFFFRKILLKTNSITHKFILYDFNYPEFRSNSVIQKEKIRLRNVLIGYGHQSIKKAISKFIKFYKPQIESFITNLKELNIFVDGRNIFYSKNANTLNINLTSILNLDKNIKQATTNIFDKLSERGIINKENRNKCYNYYLIFNERYKEILNTLNLVNCKILYTPMGTNDDIFQLYLWLSYSGCILISNDKHSDFINKINENVYLTNLFQSMKNDFQYTF